ncbi:MAG: S8 family serine peptidase [Actinomycetota bacterium]|nr:S8 family serine peptidase [Actinomycetota bacterium]
MRLGGRILLATLTVAALLGAAPASTATVTPNDPLFEHCGDPKCLDEQWDLRSDGRGISADTAWTVTRGAGVVIASLDSGLDFTQPDLENQIWNNPGETGLDASGHDRRTNGLDDDHNGYVDDWRGWDFYENDNDATDDTGYGHGTGTAGVAVAQQDNGIGVSGVAPEAKLMVLRVSDTFLASGVRVAQAIRYAADNGADVVTMSIGSTDSGKALRDAVAYAEGKGVVMVAATANEFSVHPNSPTWLDPVIGVGAIVPDTDGTGLPTASDFTVKATYSNYGPVVDVVAPTDTFTTDFGGGFGKISGTSGATPHVAGVAALVISRARALGLTLSPQEVTQIIRQSADDLVGGPYHYAKGWDRFTGWGRVDAAAAVDMVTADAGKIPPVADINAPDWYRTVKGHVAVTGTVSARNGPYDWTLSVGRGMQPGHFTVLAKGSGSAPFTGKLGTFLASKQRNGLCTLRLQVTDGNGAAGQDRQGVVVLRDPTLRRHFPIDLHGSVESSPQFADLNGDGSDELIVADSNGLVHAFQANGHELPGWPVEEDPIPIAGSDLRAGFTSSPAVADLDRDGHPDVVIGGLDGKVYAWNHKGKPLPGWPVATRTPFGPDPAHPHWESTVISSPAVGELDGTAKDGPEVVVGGGDGRVYAFHAGGSPLGGWPVLLDDPAQPGMETAKIASSPAIGDIDGDGHNEVVIGDGETYGTTARVYALRGDGSYQKGWPVAIDAVAPNSIPVVGQGVPESPVLADVNHDGAMEVAISAFTSRFHLLTGHGKEFHGGATAQGGVFFSGTFGANRDPHVGTQDSVATVANLAFGDLDRDGHPDLVTGSTDTRLFGAAVYAGKRQEFQHLVSAWSTRTGAYLTAFPRVVEDWMFLTASVLADVDGDGKPEILIGNGAGDVHAFRTNGSEPHGWPKFVGQWVQASVAAGDLDGNGRIDVAVVTRQGSVFVFRTNGRPTGSDWPNMRGTPANTGAFASRPK